MSCVHEVFRGERGHVPQLGQYDAGTLCMEQQDAARSDERECKCHPNHPPPPFSFLPRQFFWKDWEGLKAVTAYRLRLEANSLNLNGQGNSADMWST